jgi:putative intracellular protease/amidase
MSTTTKPNFLIILTSHSTITAASPPRPTGWWLPEFAHPFYVLSPYFNLVIASPKGGVAPLDPLSIELHKEDEESVRFLKEEEALWKNTEKIESFVGRAGEFAGLLVAGGHGRRLFPKIEG